MTPRDRALLNDCLGLIDDVINHAYNGYPAAQDVVQRAEELEDTINARLHRRGLWLRVADWGRGVAYRVRRVVGEIKWRGLAVKHERERAAGVRCAVRSCYFHNRSFEQSCDRRSSDSDECYAAVCYYYEPETKPAPNGGARKGEK